MLPHVLVCLAGSGLLGLPLPELHRPLVQRHRSVVFALEGEPTPAPKSAREALEAAEAKLEELNKVDDKSAPASWADLGLPSTPQTEYPTVPAFLQQAPLVIGVFSVLLFGLNQAGLFGEGPDLDALAEEWSKM